MENFNEENTQRFNSNFDLVTVERERVKCNFDLSETETARLKCNFEDRK